MLFPAALHDRIASGEVTLAFRAWKRPSVRAGGTLHSPAGVLAIEEVTRIEPTDVTESDARAAGAASADEVRASLREGDERVLYRIRFHRAADDPRVELRRKDRLDDVAFADIAAQLARWDRAGRDGPWTAAVLDVIERRPEVVSTELAAALGMERLPFKRRVRQLKSIGLTESLERGYRLSPRGVAYLRAARPPTG
jgi:hypothetical protein